MTGKLIVVALLAVGLVAGAVAWWLRPADGPVTIDAVGDSVQTVRRGRLPVFADTADLGRLYRFAAGHKDWLEWMPCTCGCADLGHASNRACYVKSETADTVTFTSHAAT